MAFTEVAAGNTATTTETIYPKLADIAANTVLAEGIFSGSNEGQYGLTYYIAQADGVSVGLSDWGKLKFLINKANLVENKSVIRVTYLGKEIMEEGAFAGKPAHNFKLEVDA